MPRDRDHSRERSPVSQTHKDSKSYRDRSDRPTKRKHREASEDLPAPLKKKIQLAVQNRKENDYPSVNELKRRIRDVKRLLNREDLPADVRIIQERALSGYEKDLEDEMQRRNRSQMIKKYHFVRFLDRKSATKNLNRLLRREKDITNASDIDPQTKEKTLQSLRPKIHVARVNLNYTIYYPLNDKYISLYAEQKKQKKAPDSGTDQQTDDEDHPNSGVDEKSTTTAIIQTTPMWRTVEKCMEDGTLDLLREGKLNSSAGSKEEEQQPTATTDKKEKKKTTKTTTSQETKKSAEKSASKAKSKKRGDEDDRKGKREKRGATKDVAMRDYDNGQDDDESDGGFFEI